MDQGRGAAPPAGSRGQQGPAGKGVDAGDTERRELRGAEEDTAPREQLPPACALCCYLQDGLPTQPLGRSAANHYHHHYHHCHHLHTHHTRSCKPLSPSSQPSASSSLFPALITNQDLDQDSVIKSEDSYGLPEVRVGIGRGWE